MIRVERPGVQINISSAPNKLQQKDGVVALVLPLDKGNEGSDFVALSQADDLNGDFTLGGMVNLKYLPLIKEMLNHCSVVKIYPVMSSKQASCVVSPQVTVYASATGIYGNSLKIDIKPDTQHLGLFVATILYKDIVLETYDQVRRWTDLGARTNLLNVAYSGGGDDVVEGTTQLTGGDSPNLTIGDYTQTLSVLQKTDFNVFVTPLSIQPSDGDVWKTVEGATDSCIRDIREQDEKLKRYIVTSETSNKIANTNKPYKYVLNSTGLYMQDGSRYKDYEAKCIFAAILADTQANESLTNKKVTGATGVYNPRSNRSIEADLQNGYVMFFADTQGTVRIVKDQTAFVQQDGQTPECYTSGLCIREVDHIINRIKEDFETYWLGIQKGTEDSAKLYRDVTYALLADFQTEGYITNLEVDDVVVTLNGRNGFNLELKLQPTDSIEKLKINVEVK